MPPPRAYLEDAPSLPGRCSIENGTTMSDEWAQEKRSPFHDPACPAMSSTESGVARPVLRGRIPVAGQFERRAAVGLFGACRGGL